MEYGYKIKVVETAFETIEVDTPEDAKKAEAYLACAAETDLTKPHVNSTDYLPVKSSSVFIFRF